MNSKATADKLAYLRLAGKNEVLKAFLRTLLSEYMEEYRSLPQPQLDELILPLSDWLFEITPDTPVN